VGRRKPVNLLTAGQHLEVLRALDKQGLHSTLDQISWRTDLDVIGRIVKKRNDFTHGRFGYDDRDVQAVRMLFADLRAFCKSPIVMNVPIG